MASVIFPQHERIKQRLHGIVVALGHRIVHVVVTLRARHGDAHEAGRNGVHRRDRQILGMLARAPREQAEANRSPGLSSFAERYRSPTFASAHSSGARQLHLHKLVVGHVVVQRLDYPVPPQMNPGRRRHPLIGIGVAQDIEPMRAYRTACCSSASRRSTTASPGLRGSVR